MVEGGAVLLTVSMELLAVPRLLPWRPCWLLLSVEASSLAVDKVEMEERPQWEAGWPTRRAGVGEEDQEGSARWGTDAGGLEGRGGPDHGGAELGDLVMVLGEK